VGDLILVPDGLLKAELILLPSMWFVKIRTVVYHDHKFGRTSGDVKI